MTVPTSAEAWLASRQKTHGVQVERVTLSACTDWRIQDGELRHVSGRFFQVVGASSTSPAGETSERLLMRQEEVGILGFIVRSSGSGNEWLLQAKSEPGNVGGAHVAPTVQATQSNFQRVHGGAATRFLEWFTDRDGEHIVADVLASENGTRFLRKVNRNLIAIVPPTESGLPTEAFQWFPSSELRPLLGRSYMVGTEARSVIVSSPWSYIADGEPFGRWQGSRGFGARLVASYRSDPDLAPVLAALAADRATAPAGATAIPLADLDGWNLNAWGIKPDRGPAVDVGYFSVVARDREVGRWCQPLMGFGPISGCDIVCQVRAGLLRFLLRSRWEPGLVERVELAPSRQSETALALDQSRRERVRLSVVQSDEGGRFWRSRRRYRIVERDPAHVAPDAPTDHWLTLAQIEALAGRSTTLTNEARTALSALLSVA